MKWYFRLIIYLIAGLALVYATTIWEITKYYYYWDLKSKLVEFELDKIWKKAGVIEIYGGAETGKTLSTILLTENLKGRKWNNVPNTISGCQLLTLATLKKHCVGEFEGGVVGVNNVLFIDESWNFFGQDNLTSHGLDESSSVKLLNFLTETSKTGWKVFYVTKKGIELPSTHKILNANRSAVIRILGTRYLCEFWRKRYYFLDIEFITDPRKFDHPSDWEINQEYAVNNDDHRLKKTSTKPWWKRILGSTIYENQNVISIPYSEDNLRKFDKTWNADSEYSKNRMTGMFSAFKADGLTEFTKHEPTRVQRLQEEHEAMQYFKKHPDAGQKKQIRIKAIEIMKKKGLWKSALDQITEERRDLEQQLNQGKLSPEEYKEKIAKLLERQTKLTKEIVKKQQAKEANEIADKEQKEDISEEVQAEDEDIKETEKKEQ